MSTTEGKMLFKLNTAFSPVDPETGKWMEKEERWGEKSHDAMAKKLRGHIMAQISGDGLFNIYVGRFYIKAEYLTGRTTREKVLAAVEEGVAWAITHLNGAFPIRGDKTPTADLEDEAPRFSGEWIIKGLLVQTDLYRHTPNRESEAQLVSNFGAEIDENLPGVRGWQVGINGATVTIDPKITKPEDARDYIRALFQKHASDEHSPYLPFVKFKEVVVKWSIENIVLSYPADGVW
jgi:hypothetical protein